MWRKSGGTGNLRDGRTRGKFRWLIPSTCTVHNALTLLAVEMRHRLDGIAIALGGAWRDRLFDRGKIGLAQNDRVGGARFRPLLALAGADPRGDVFALPEHP